MKSIDRELISKLVAFFSIGSKQFVGKKNVISSLDFLRFQLILIKHRLRPLQVKWIQFETVPIGWQEQLSFEYSNCFFFRSKSIYFAYVVNNSQGNIHKILYICEIVIICRCKRFIIEKPKKRWKTKLYFMVKMQL